MFTTDIYEIKNRQKELQEKAAEYRLAQSLKRSKSSANTMFAVIEKIRTVTRQQPVIKAQPAH